MNEREKRYIEAEDAPEDAPETVAGCATCGGLYGAFVHDPITGTKTHTQCAPGMPVIRVNGPARLFGVRDDLDLPHPE